MPKMNWKTVGRDTLVVLLLTFIGGAVVGFAFGIMGQAGSPRMQIGVAFSNLIFGIVAFTIAGARTPVNRFMHLTWVALATWIASLFNVAFLGVTIVQWMWALVFLMILVGIGGGISFLFVATPKTPDATRPPA